jgi:hypothetical protein
MIPADTLEVRTSLIKLILFSLLLYAVPIGLAIGVPIEFTFYVLRGGTLDELDSPIIGFVFYLLDILVVWSLVDMWRQFATTKVIFKITEAGLIIPSFGSGRPIPWRYIDYRRIPTEGFLMGFFLYADVDPKDYPYARGQTLLRRLYGRRLWVPRIFNVSQRRLLGAISSQIIAASRSDVLGPL